MPNMPFGYLPPNYGVTMQALMQLTGVKSPRPVLKFLDRNNIHPVNWGNQRLIPTTPVIMALENEATNGGPGISEED